MNNHVHCRRFVCVENTALVNGAFRPLEQLVIAVSEDKQGPFFRVPSRRDDPSRAPPLSTERMMHLTNLLSVPAEKGGTGDERKESQLFGGAWFLASTLWGIRSVVMFCFHVTNWAAQYVTLYLQTLQYEAMSPTAGGTCKNSLQNSLTGRTPQSVV